MAKSGFFLMLIIYFCRLARNVPSLKKQKLKLAIFSILLSITLIIFYNYVLGAVSTGIN